MRGTACQSSQGRRLVDPHQVVLIESMPLATGRSTRTVARPRLWRDLEWRHSLTVLADRVPGAKWQPRPENVDPRNAVVAPRPNSAPKAGTILDAAEYLFSCTNCMGSPCATLHNVGIHDAPSSSSRTGQPVRSGVRDGGVRAAAAWWRSNSTGGCRHNLTVEGRCTLS
jgi:hypothetical protein